MPDPTPLETGNKARRLCITLPRQLVQKIDAAARRQRISRSAFLARASQWKLDEDKR